MHIWSKLCRTRHLSCDFRIFHPYIFIHLAPFRNTVFPSPPPSYNMSSTAVSVAGVTTFAYVSRDILMSRLSSRFLQYHFPRKSRFSQVEMIVSACLHLVSFTCVLEFVVDPALEQCDIVLGLDWSRQCELAGMLSLAVCLPCLDEFGA